MTLPKGERAIIASFHRAEEAEQAQTELKKMGLKDITMERSSQLHAAERYERHPENAITGEFPGLASAVYDKEMDRDAGVLASADPSSSGMSDRSAEDVGRDYVLTVVVNEKQYKEAGRIIKQHGGEF